MNWKFISLISLGFGSLCYGLISSAADNYLSKNAADMAVERRAEGVEEDLKWANDNIRKADEINDTVFDLCLGKHPEGRDDIIHSKSDDKAEHHTNAFGRVQQLTDQYHRQHIRNRCDPSDDQTSEKLYPCVTGIFK